VTLRTTFLCAGMQAALTETPTHMLFSGVVLQEQPRSCRARHGLDQLRTIAYLFLACSGVHYSSAGTRTMAHVSDDMSFARRPALSDNRNIPRSRAGSWVVARYPIMVRSCVGLIILACFPWMVASRSPWPPYLYDNRQFRQKYYQFMAAPS
jgi:hypothetical protein